MFTGEFDASSLDLEGSNPLVPIIFLFFVFLMTIVLFNLLNALAIDDTQRIRLEGKLIDSCERIDTISKYERVFLGQYGGNRIKKTISLFPYTVPQGKIVIHPDNSNEIMIYKTISTKKEVSIEIEEEGGQELKNFNDSALCHKIKDRLETSPLKLNENIMITIHQLLHKKKRKQNIKEAKSKSKLEAEVRTLKISVQELTAKFNQQFSIEEQKIA